jgi:hypothetical protein
VRLSVIVSVWRGVREPSCFLVAVAESGESMEKILGARGAGTALSVSLYTKGGTAGNWPQGRRKARKCKELVERSEL